MSLSEATKRRLPRIKIGLLRRKNREQIGQDCGVTEKTIDRDIQTWVKTDDYDEWLDDLWLQLLQEVYDKNKLEVFREVSRLKGKRITRKMEVKEEIREHLEVVTLNVTENEDDILNKAAAILDKRLSEKKQPRKIH